MGRYGLGPDEGSSMRILLNYATPDLRALQRASSRSALRFGGFDRVVERSPADLDRAFQAAAAGRLP